MAEHEPSSRPGISHTRPTHIAAWLIGLHPDEANRMCADIVEKTYARGVCICPKNTLLKGWAGVVTGLIKIGTVSPEGRSITFTGVSVDGWSGEGMVLKNKSRRYDIATLRDTHMAFMGRVTFMWLMENSVAFNRSLVKQLNEWLRHFMTLLECDRLLDVTPRLVRCIASLFSPALYPGTDGHLEITQEEPGLLSGMAHQVASQPFKTLEKDDVVRLGCGGVTVIDLDRLHSCGA